MRENQKVIDILNFHVFSFFALLLCLEKDFRCDLYVVKVKNNFSDDFDNFSKNIVLRHFGSKVDREKLHIILSTIFIRENYNYFLYLKNINRIPGDFMVS